MAVGNNMINNAKLTETEVQRYKDHIIAVFKGINGHDVSEYDMAHPSEAVLPYQLKGGRILQDLPEVSRFEDTSKIFERQLGFCQTQWCLTSTGCLIMQCGKYLPLDTPKMDC